MANLSTQLTETRAEPHQATEKLADEFAALAVKVVLKENNEWPVLSELASKKSPPRAA